MFNTRGTAAAVTFTHRVTVWSLLHFTFVFQHSTDRRQSHCDWLLSSPEGAADPVGGQRKWASVGLSARLSLAVRRKKAGFDTQTVLVSGGVVGSSDLACCCWRPAFGCR